MPFNRAPIAYIAYLPQYSQPHLASVTIVLVSDTMGHILKSCRIHALTGQSCFGGTRRTIGSGFYVVGGRNVVAEWWHYPPVHKSDVAGVISSFKN